MSDLDFDLFMRRLGQRAKAHPQMINAMVELTYGCNLRCVHCYNPTHDARNELTTEQLHRILDELAAQGCLWVGFTGGELFTRRDAFDIMNYAKSLGLITNILTNATMITPAIADQIQRLDPYLVEVSVYGATAETYEAVTRVPGSFVKFVRGVEHLIERRVPVLLKLVMLTLNAHEHKAMQDLARGWDLRYQTSTEIHPRVDGSLSPLAHRLSPQQAFEIWREESGEKLVERRASRSDLSNQQHPAAVEEEGCGLAGQLFRCRCGKSSAAVTPYGKLNLCLSLYHPQYDLIQGNLDEGWQHLVDLVAATGPGPSYECTQCPVTRYCTRSVADSWLEEGIFDSGCLAYFRDLAGLKAQFLEKSHNG